MLLERMLWSLLPPDTLNISKAVNNMLTDFFALLPEVFSFIEEMEESHTEHPSNLLKPKRL